jgi:ABC-type ATPase with predicted acetyltransferase domain
LRADRTAHGGDIAAYVRSDLPCDRKRKLEFNIVESINIEILIADKKWLISGYIDHKQLMKKRLMKTL